MVGRGVGGGRESEDEEKGNLDNAEDGEGEEDEKRAD